MASFLLDSTVLYHKLYISGAVQYSTGVEPVQVNPPKTNSVFRIKSTITIPIDWKPLIDEYMKRMGFQDYAELFRHLIRIVIVEAHEG